MVMGLVAGSMVYCTSSFACTALVITDVNGAGYNGKTMEFSVPIPLSMEYVPEGTKIRSMTPDGKSGKVFTTKYPVLGLAMTAFPNANQDTMVEGINNQGLSLSSNEFNNSQAPANLGKNNANILAATES